MDNPRPTPSKHMPATNAGVMAVLILFVLCTWIAITQAPAQIKTDWSSTSSFWQPIERNAFARLSATGPVFDAAFAPDGQSGFALVLPNALARTGDGGRTWSLLSQELFNTSVLTFSADGRQGWAAGPMTLRHSLDGGVHWTDVTDPVLNNKWWKSLAFDPTGKTGVMVAADGTLATTDNFGANWRVPREAQRDGPARYGKLIATAWSEDNSIGWVVGAGGRFGRIMVGGSFWGDVATGLPASTTFIQVHFLKDALRGWIVGDNGDLYASTDGGSSWHPVPYTVDGKFFDVRFAQDARRGWAITQDSAVFATQDGGVHWERRSQPAQSAPGRLDVAADGSRIFLTGYWGVKTSNDGGASWQAATRDALNKLAAIAFGADGKQGWAVGEGGTVLRSTDGGASWVAQASGVAADLQGLAVAPDGLHAWASGAGGTLLQTGDGGRQWTGTVVGDGQNLRRVVLSANGLRGLVVGQRGAIWLTTDGGRIWRKPRNGFAPQELNDVAVLEDAKNVRVSSITGDVLHSLDGGDTWSTEMWNAEAFAGGATALPKFGRDGKPEWLDRNERRGCKPQSGGKLGNAAAVNPANDPCTTQLAAFQGTGGTGWSIVPGGNLQVTHDRGQSWQSAWAPYQRLPGPWYWMAVLLLATGLLLALRAGRTGAAVSGTVNMFADDDAITDFDDDRLEFGPLARGLSRFLRNPKTSPPLTLSITGDWGAGKSSLMRLLCADLRRYRQRPIWFNAWHHQKEEQLFSALLGTIQAQAAPSSWRPAGWMFRLKLLWIRSKRHFLLSFLVLVLLAFALGVQVQQGNEWADIVALAQAVPDLFSAPGAVKAGGLGEHVTAAAPFVALLTAARLLYKGMQSFGVDPALMFKGTADKSSLKQASAQNTFRTTFAREFDEVAAALPYRMTIVVDDLDRCRPENILEVLETVNFLTASGQCFIVFGMASERVEAALRMAFEKVAAEMDGLQGDAPGAADQGDPAAQARHRRRVYARDYLEKLINLEIKVPARGDIGADALFVARTTRRATAGEAAIRTLAGYWPFWLAALAICAGIVMANEVKSSRADWLRAPTPVAAAVPAPAPANATTIPAAMPNTSAEQADDMKKLPSVFKAGAGTLAWTAYVPSAAAALFLLGLACIHGLLRVRAQALEVQDTEAFRNGLKIWTELAVSRRTTPRAIKRWGNRMRYFAMLQQGAVVEDTLWQRGVQVIALYVGQWRRRLQLAGSALSGTRARRLVARACRAMVRMLPAPPSPDVPQPVRHTMIEEGRLIAIGAVHEVYQGGWLEALDGVSTLPPEHLIRRAVMRYEAVTGAGWRRITDEEADTFERLLAGIKLPAPQGNGGN